MGSEWGQWITKLKELSNAPGGLDPECREAEQFRTTFRLPYEIYLGVLDAVKSIFPSASRDVAGRECVPVELKVSRLRLNKDSSHFPVDEHPEVDINPIHHSSACTFYTAVDSDCFSVQR